MYKNMGSAGGVCVCVCPCMHINERITLLLASWWVQLLFIKDMVPTYNLHTSLLHFKPSPHCRQSLYNADSLAIIVTLAGLHNTKREEHACIFTACINIVCKHLLVQRRSDLCVRRLWGQGPTMVLVGLHIASLFNSSWLEKPVITRIHELNSTYSLGRDLKSLTLEEGSHAHHSNNATSILLNEATGSLALLQPGRPMHMAASDQFPSMMS